MNAGPDPSSAPPPTGAPVGRAPVGRAPVGRARVGRALVGRAARLVVSVGLVAVLIWRLPEVRAADLIPRWRTSIPLWLGAAILAQELALALQAVRWQRVLLLFERTLPLPLLWRYTVAGQFVANVLPTSFGGDIVRVTRAGSDLADHPVGAASVLLERLTGWLVLPVITAFGFALRPGHLHLGAATAWAIAISMGTLAALGVVLGLAALSSPEAPAGAGGVRRFLAQLSLGVRALHRHPRGLGSVLAAGMGFQVLLCVSIWCVAKAIGDPRPDLVDLLVFFPVVAIAQNAPLGVNGLGVRETMLVLFLSPVGASRGSAISLGLGYHVVVMAASVVGAPALVASLRGGRAGPPPGSRGATRVPPSALHSQGPDGPQEDGLDAARTHQ